MMGDCIEKTARAPAQAARNEAGLSRSPMTTSAPAAARARAFGASASRTSTRTKVWPSASKARAVAPPWRPVAAVTRTVCLWVMGNSCCKWGTPPFKFMVKYGGPPRLSRKGAGGEECRGAREAVAGGWATQPGADCRDGHGVGRAGWRAGVAGGDCPEGGGGLGDPAPALPVAAGAAGGGLPGGGRAALRAGHRAARREARR